MVQYGQAVDQLERQAYLPAVQCDHDIHRPVHGDVARLGGECQGKQAIGQRVGCGDELLGGNGAALRAQSAAQAGAVRNHEGVRAGDFMRGILSQTGAYGRMARQ